MKEQGPAYGFGDKGGQNSEDGQNQLAQVDLTKGQPYPVQIHVVQGPTPDSLN